ncbi:hypothetical protein [Streptomyces sp. NPDC020362]|uniref:hypothetical protein n=1 Tax=unclassified Streptomyces TaxID=2593676 RepID=UPI0033EC9B71
MKEYLSCLPPSPPLALSAGGVGSAGGHDRPGSRRRHDSGRTFAASLPAHPGKTTTTTETTTMGRHKFHPHDQNIAGNGPVNGQ